VQKWALSARSGIAGSLRYDALMTAAFRVAIVLLITVGGVRAQVDPEQVRARDAAIQAFRAAPSLARFSAAGQAIMDATDWRPSDDSNPTPPPRNRDFEGMKATLAAGVVVSMSALPAMPSPVPSPHPRVTATMLPAVRPSFFTRDEPLFVIALRPFKLVDEDVVSVVDALSAVNRLMIRVRVAEPMSFGPNGPLGAWDVGAVEARFDRDALVHGVARGGQVTGYNVRSIKAPIGSQLCSVRDGSVIGTRVNPEWASAIVGWIGKPAPGGAIVTSRQSGGAGAHDRLVNEIIDLDRDGVADFSTWAGIDRSEVIDDVDLPWKAVFVNVAGKWLLGSYRSAPDCT
jgi:hypothetical protein